MRIGFLGLGSLGLPVALAIASRGHEVLAWDIDERVRESIITRRPLHREEGVVEQLTRTDLCLRLIPPRELVAEAEIVFVAVQTPHAAGFDGTNVLPDERRDFSYEFLRTAVTGVAEAARAIGRTSTLAVMSTVLPGTLEREVRPLLGPDVRLVYNPSFTAAGTAMHDFLSPEFVLLGTDGEEAAAATLRAFYGTIHDRPVLETDIRTAELTKLAYNTFIGQKLVFVNAMMELSHRLGANVDDLSDALGLATDRIVSRSYLRGGMGDGGACHPRDNIALSWLARQVGLSHDVFTDIMRARDEQTGWLAGLVEERANGRPVVVLGKSYKPQSDLTAGSPALLLASLLESRGVAFEHVDHRVDGGAPEIDANGAALFFVATKHPEYAEVRFPPGSTVLDPWGYVPDQENVEVIRIGRRSARPDAER